MSSTSSVRLFLERAFDYNHRVNGSLAGHLRSNNASLPGQVNDLFNHLINAHYIWNARLLGASAAFQVWEQHQPENWQQLLEAAHNQSLDFLKKAKLNDSIRYVNTQGEGYDSLVMDVFYHVLNHSNYHRGQVNLLLRQAGQTPLVTDYVFLMRTLAV